MSYIQRHALGIDLVMHGLKVHAAGGHINKYAKRIRTEVNEKTELEFYQSDYDGKFLWIEYNYYSPTQSKTHSFVHLPNKYEEVGRKLKSIFDELFLQENN